MNWLNFKRWGVCLGLLLISFVPAEAAMSFPNINIGMQTANTPQDFTNGLQILIWLTILTLAPSILIMTTSFVRLVVVLSLTRQAWCRYTASKSGNYKFSFNPYIFYNGTYV